MVGFGCINRMITVSVISLRKGYQVQNATVLKIKNKNIKQHIRRKFLIMDDLKNVTLFWNILQIFSLAYSRFVILFWNLCYEKQRQILHSKIILILINFLSFLSSLVLLSDIYLSTTQKSKICDSNQEVVSTIHNLLVILRIYNC